MLVLLRVSERSVRTSGVLSSVLEKLSMRAVAQESAEDATGDLECFDDRRAGAGRRAVGLAPRSQIFFRPEEVEGRSERVQR